MFPTGDLRHVSSFHHFKRSFLESYLNTLRSNLSLHGVVTRFLRLELQLRLPPADAQTQAGLGAQVLVQEAHRYLLRHWIYLDMDSIRFNA